MTAADYQPSPHRTNISEHEYAYKHRLLFEASRRYEIGRLRSRKESSLGIAKRRLHVFTPIDETSETNIVGSQARAFSYDVNIPKKRDSITEIEDAQLRFLLIPTECAEERRININFQQENNTLQVDACKPRWESLSVSLTPSQLNRLTMHCTDCLEKAVTFTRPYLNVITVSKPKKRDRRRLREKVEQSKCARTDLRIVFEKMEGYQWILYPKSVDIGKCAGFCSSVEQVGNQHAKLQFKHMAVHGGQPTCCTPHEYKKLQFLSESKENNGQLQMREWPDAIAVSCACH